MTEPKWWYWTQICAFQIGVFFLGWAVHGWIVGV